MPSAIRKESLLIRTICPGDFVFVSYDEIPIIEDMHCEEGFESAKRDNELGGSNDWFIDAKTQYSKGGFMVKARRKLKTSDKLDWKLQGEPERILFGISESSYVFERPEKTGYRGFGKYKMYDQDN